MPYQYILHQSAYEEYLDAFEWYEFKQQGLGKRFMSAVDKTLKQIAEYPEHFSKQKTSFRAAKVKGFPYSIVYEYYPRKGFIHIASIYHGKRNPAKKYRRLKN